MWVSLSFPWFPGGSFGFPYDFLCSVSFFGWYNFKFGLKGNQKGHPPILGVSLFRHIPIVFTNVGLL